MARVGTGSLSVMVPVAVTPPKLSGTVSVGSFSVSCTVGRVTEKLVTPAGTIRLPPTSVTPSLNVGVP